MNIKFRSIFDLKAKREEYSLKLVFPPDPERSKSFKKLPEAEDAVFLGLVGGDLDFVGEGEGLLGAIIGLCWSGSCLAIGALFADI